MIIKFLDKDNEQYKQDIYRLIEAADMEFIPPLSNRCSTTQKNLLPAQLSNSDFTYYNNVMAQHILVAIERNHVIGFASFIKDYVCGQISKSTIPNIYVTTIIVSKESRKRGVASQLYNYLKEHYHDRRIYTRTWSTNESHMHVLNNQEFHLYSIINNDRGENIDTVYFECTPQIHLKRAQDDYAEFFWRLQAIGFADMLEKYQDFETNPGNEPLTKVKNKMVKPNTNYYFIMLGPETIGGINVWENYNGDKKKIAPLFILPEFRNKGYASQTIKEVERIYGSTNWVLDTVEEEEKNCKLYEKFGYKKTSKRHVLNDKTTIIEYRK